MVSDDKETDRQKEGQTESERMRVTKVGYTKQRQRQT